MTFVNDFDKLKMVCIPLSKMNEQSLADVYTLLSKGVKQVLLGHIKENKLNVRLTDSLVKSILSRVLKSGTFDVVYKYDFITKTFDEMYNNNPNLVKYLSDM